MNELKKKALILIIPEGTVNGKEMTSRKRYNVETSATSQGMVTVANTIAELMSKDLNEILDESQTQIG